MRPDSRLNLLLTPPAPPKGGGGVALAQPWHQTVTRLLVPLGVRTFEATSGTEAMELIERHPIHLAVVDTRLPSISGMNVLQLIQRLRERGQHLPPAFSAPASGGVPTGFDTGSTGVPTAQNAPSALVPGAIDAPSTRVPGATSAGSTRDGEASDAGSTPIQAGFRLHMEMEERTPEGARRFEVRIDAQMTSGGVSSQKSPCGPVVILIAPPVEEQDKQLMQEALKFNAFSVLTEPVDVNVALDVMARAMKRWFSGQWPC